LESVLGRVNVAEDSPGDAEYHSAVSPNQKLECVGVPVCSEPGEQAGVVGRVRSAAGKPENSAERSGGHGGPFNRSVPRRDDLIRSFLHVGSQTATKGPCSD
jgi:hypothetical protein